MTAMLIRLTKTLIQACNVVHRPAQPSSGSSRNACCPAWLFVLHPPVEHQVLQTVLHSRTDLHQLVTMNQQLPQASRPINDGVGKLR